MLKKKMLKKPVIVECVNGVPLVDMKGDGYAFTIENGTKAIIFPEEPWVQALFKEWQHIEKVYAALRPFAVWGDDFKDKPDSWTLAIAMHYLRNARQVYGDPWDRPNEPIEGMKS